MPRSAAAKKEPQARDNPVHIRKELDTRSHKAGQDKPRKMNSRGAARDSLEDSVIESVGRVVSKDKLEALKFNEDVLTIRVHDSTDVTVEQIPEVWNDGKVQRFIRNTDMQVKRKYVEVLVRAIKTTFSQQKVKDGNGDDTIINVPHSALKYPFSVLHDPSPRGAAWLKNLMDQA